MAQRPDSPSGNPGGPPTPPTPGAPGEGGPGAGEDALGGGPAAAAPGPPPAASPAIDLLGMDLETLRTTEHPVLAALVEELRLRVASPGSEALWGFDNAPPPAAPPPTSAGRG